MMAAHKNIWTFIRETLRTCVIYIYMKHFEISLPLQRDTIIVIVLLNTYVLVYDMNMQHDPAKY